MSKKLFNVIWPFLRIEVQHYFAIKYLGYYLSYSNIWKNGAHDKKNGPLMTIFLQEKDFP